MSRLSNPTNQLVHLNLTVKGEIWEQTMAPFSDIELPTNDHVEAVRPYLRDLHLRIVGTDLAPAPASSTVATIEVVTVPPLSSAPPPAEPSAAVDAPADLPAAALEIPIEPEPPDTSVWGDTAEEAAIQIPNELVHKTRAELRQLCSERGLTTGGTRDELLMRLTQAGA